MNANSYAVVYFKKDNTYSIIADSKKIKNQKIVKVYHEETKSWNSGEIVLRGTEKSCLNYAKFELSKTDAKFVASDDDKTEAEDPQESFVKSNAKNSSKSNFNL
jgi:hypothetical protein